MDIRCLDYSSYIPMTLSGWGTMSRGMAEVAAGPARIPEDQIGV